MRALRKNQNALGLVLLALFFFSTALVPYARVAAAPVFRQIICTEEDLAFAWPYTKFVETQGPHGASYGDYAYDLAAGRGAPVLSPINGEVTKLGTDGLGNTYVYIKNTCYEVKILHGRYTVAVGQSLQIGNVIGTESNQGNTTGYGGVVCASDATPNCGNHTHLNVREANTGKNLDAKSLVNHDSVVNGNLPEKVALIVPDSPAEVQETVQTGKGNLFHWLFANWMWFVLAFALIFVITGAQHGLSLRTTLAIVGIGLLIYAWWIPSTSTWLESPVDGSIPIKTHYGDVRVDPQGTTTTTWAVAAGTPIRAIAPGIVVNTPDSLEGYFGYQQVWVDTGNGLYIQYAMPASSSAKVLSGTKVKTGQEIGITAAGELRLGVSSKAPTEFVSIDDRTYGWMDPEEYLGKSTLSGGRKNEAVFMGVGFILLIIALFWPKKEETDELTFPWNRSMARYQNIKLILGFCIVAIGIMLDGPWFMWLGTVPLSLSLTYFIGRLGYRRSSEWGVSTRSYLMSILSMIFETTLVVGLIIAGVANPDIIFIRRAVALDLPQVTTPRLQEWNPPSLVEDDEVAPSNPIYNLSDTHAIEPFTFRYWNGGMYRVDIPQEVWDASIAADQKHGCDYRLILAVAWSESPNFTNHTSENSAGAMGTWQFIPGTWNGYWPDPTTRPPRTDIGASADAACRKAVDQGLPTSGSRSIFIDRFAHHPVGGSVWNMHDGQAGTVYDLWQELKNRTQ